MKDNWEFLRRHWKKVVPVVAAASLACTCTVAFAVDLTAAKRPEPAAAKIAEPTSDAAPVVRPAKTENLSITAATREYVDLTWDTVKGADGYLIYRSADDGAYFATIANISDGKISSFQDRTIQTNASYLYRVAAYAYAHDILLCGKDSDAVSHQTPLDQPVLTSVAGIAHDTMQLRWNAVAGAVGYQIWKSSAQDGEYTCIAEFTDGAATAYNDGACECAAAYFYYIKACQMRDGAPDYGDASSVVGGRTTPNKVVVSGTVSGEYTEVSLSWQPAAGAQGYELYRSVGGSGSYQLVQTFGADAAFSWTDTGLDKSTEYMYRIRAYCTAKDGQTVFGTYSAPFRKEAVYDYAALSGNIAGILQYAGVRYVPGGTTPQGWDCSGFTKWALQQCFGVVIPKGAAAQGAGGRTISKTDRSQWMPGDILCYTEGGRVSHVALYLGDGKIMHALNQKYNTLIQDVDYYERWDKATSLYCVKRWF